MCLLPSVRLKRPLSKFIIVPATKEKIKHSAALRPSGALNRA